MTTSQDDATAAFRHIADDQYNRRTAELERQRQAALEQGPADDYGHPEAVIVWLGIAACFFLGGPLAFLTWPRVALPLALDLLGRPTPMPSDWLLAGAAAAVLLLALGMAATGRMLTRKEPGR